MRVLNLFTKVSSPYFYSEKFLIPLELLMDGFMASVMMILDGFVLVFSRERGGQGYSSRLTLNTASD